ncbi:TPA: DUF3820 family protein [Vibrio parahaemolyticus]|uniref:putative quorum-sensing-regulated virulence factor n=1 Tax=Vibrio campbellii TaxID=680 RepID=UPI001F075576|nr:DUF3820 family protein [Vibrio campbellii]UMM06766.1 DUF3820 family protein [Vibrio campbellii]
MFHVMFVFFAIVLAVYFVCQFSFQTLQNQKVNEEEEPSFLTESGLVSDYVVLTNSDAERVHNLEQLVVRFGKHKGKKWADVPTKYLQWMVAEEHKYVQLAQVILAARLSNYTFI